MEDVLTTMARQFLPQMTREERSEALLSLKRLIDEEFFALAIAESGDEPARDVACPRCGSDHVVKRGFDARGEQRYLCRRCSRTFTSRTNRVFATTKLDHATWMRFSECHVDALTLRESAERCGVSLKTAFCYGQYSFRQLRQYAFTVLANVHTPNAPTHFRHFWLPLLPP
jgi:Transposase and inactivated derivatives